MNVFMPGILDSLSDWGQYGILIFLAAANGVFIFYDFFLSSMANLYVEWFRPKFLRKFK